MSLLQGERFSAPFQCLASASATLQPHHYQHQGSPNAPMNAKEFVHLVSSQRISSNFPKEVVYAKAEQKGEK